MTRPPVGEPREPDASDGSDGSDGSESEVSETGVGWPDERPRPAAPPSPPASVPGPPAGAPSPPASVPGHPASVPGPPASAPGSAAGAPGSAAADPHREAAVRRLRQQAERDRAAGGPASVAGVPPLTSQPVRPARPSELPGTRRRVPEPIVPERPGNVTAAAVILFVGAGLAVLSCCGVNFLAGEADLSAAEQNLIMLFSGLLLVGGLANGVLGYYILQGRRWARVATIVLCVIGIVLSVVNQFASFGDAEATGPLSTCLGVIVNALVIGLLSGERASYYFRFANT